MPAPANTLDELILKVMPPRVPRDLVRRRHLQLADPTLAALPLLVVEAPAGFGKTWLLTQWRVELLAHGVVVAWLAAPPHDDAAHFLRALVLSVRAASGRPQFAQELFEAPPDNPLEGATAWLAEVALASVQIALVIDEAEQLASPLHDVLTYLVRNAPSNLRCIVAVRGHAPGALDELVAYGSCLKVSSHQMRFSLDETLELARLRFGTRFDHDLAARVHEIAEGWPLGVQLALAAHAAAGAVPQLNLHGGALARPFVGVLLRNLNSDDLDFIARVSVVDELHPELAQRLVPGVDAPKVLRRLLRTAPIFQLREQRPWLRMHSLAREALKDRLHAWPASELERLHAVAADWLAVQGLFEAAAWHAHASGQSEQAYDLAERGLYEAMVQHGQQVAVQRWLSLVPDEQLDRRPRIMLAGAWALASSERHADAERLVHRILERHGADDALRCECALVQCAAAVFADDPDRYAALLDPWETSQPLSDPILQRTYAYRRGFRDLVAGEPGLARLGMPRTPAGQSYAYSDYWGLVVVAASYLYEGQPLAAREVLGPALAQAELLMGRRSPLVCTQAVAYADALHDSGASDEATVVLAGRLDVISRHCGPETLARAYRVLTRLAVSAGREDRAIDLLTQLDAVGQARDMPRMRIISACESVRLHARSFRGDMCRTLFAEAEALAAAPDAPQGPIWRRGVRLALGIAAGYAALAQRRWREAASLFEMAHAGAVQSRSVKAAIELAALRGLAAAELGEDAGSLLREAAELAGSLGLRNVLAEAHPGVTDLLRDVPSGLAQRGQQAPVSTAPAMHAPPLAGRAVATAALTPKEGAVLELAARGLSNKEIGRALAAGEETVKWHMKNVFFKLDTGSRKQAVAKARLFGLIPETV